MIPSVLALLLVSLALVFTTSLLPVNAIITTRAQIYVPILSSINSLTLTTSPPSSPPAYFVGDNLTAIWTYTLAQYNQTKPTVAHHKAAALVIHLSPSTTAATPQSNPLILATAHYSLKSLQFTIPTTIPAGQYTISITSIHDRSITFTTPFAISSRCQTVLCDAQPGTSCNFATGTCDPDPQTSPLFLSPSSIDQDDQDCSTLICKNGSTCVDPSAPSCTCPTTDVFILNPSGGGIGLLTLIRYTAPDCSAILPFISPLPIPESANCDFNFCGHSGYPKFDSATQKCTGECYCSESGWVADPVTKKCVKPPVTPENPDPPDPTEPTEPTRCAIQESNTCNPTNTDFDQTYSPTGTCDKCICKDHFSGVNCELQKVYISFYLYEFHFGQTGPNPSIIPVSDNLAFFSAESAVNSAVEMEMMTDLLYTASTTILKPAQIDSLRSTLAAALTYDKTLIQIESNVQPALRLIVSIALNPIVLPIDDLNLRWLQFRKQMLISPLHRTTQPSTSALATTTSGANGIFSPASISKGLLPDLLYDPSCPSLEEIRTSLASQSTDTATTAVQLHSDGKKPSLDELYAMLRRRELNKAEFNTVGLNSQANSYPTTYDAQTPISTAENDKISNPLVNPYTYRCVYNQDPFESNSISPDSPIAPPMQDSFALEQNLNVPRWDPDASEAVVYIPFQGEWLDNHGTEILVSAVFTVFFGLVVIFIVAYEINAYKSMDPHAVRTQLAAKATLQLIHEEKEEDRRSENRITLKF